MILISVLINVKTYCDASLDSNDTISSSSKKQDENMDIFSISEIGIKMCSGIITIFYIKREIERDVISFFCRLKCLFLYKNLQAFEDDRSLVLHASHTFKYVTIIIKN